MCCSSPGWATPRSMAATARRAGRPLPSHRLRQRGAGRMPLPEGPLSATTMADDAGALLRALEIWNATWPGSRWAAPSRRSWPSGTPSSYAAWVLVSTYARPVAPFRSQLNFWRWLPEVAPSERGFFAVFCTWAYTPRAHAGGTVDQIVDEALAFPSGPSRPFKRRSTSASRTTRRTAFRRSPRRRWCCPASPTSSCRRASVELSPRASRTRTSRSCPGRRTSPSGRSQTSSTPASTPSGAESRREG
jgi:hypothetical protein